MFSTVIPAYSNHENDHALVLSIKKQTDLNYEIILADDGSDKPTISDQRITGCCTSSDNADLPNDVLNDFW